MPWLCLRGYQAHTVKSTVLKYRYYGPIEGRVIGIDKSAFGAMRLTLDLVSLRKKKIQIARVGSDQSFFTWAASGHILDAR